jgi:Rrf2 family protein
MLTGTTQSALRALACLAALPPGEVLLGRQLAERAGVPSSFLAKVLLSLNRAGLVRATRGLGGGYQLDRPAEAVSLWQVVALFDPLDTCTGCLLDSSRPCSEAAPCLVHRRWVEIRDAYVSFLETTTLDQIARPWEPQAPGSLVEGANS